MLAGIVIMETRRSYKHGRVEDSFSKNNKTGKSIVRATIRKP